MLDETPGPTNGKNTGETGKYQTKHRGQQREKYIYKNENATKPKMTNIR